LATTEVFAILCVFLLVLVVLREQGQTARRSIEAVERLSHRESVDMRNILEKVVLLKGLAPHFVDPKTFTPGGHSWDVYNEMKAQQVQEQRTQGASLEEASNEQGAMQDLAEYHRMLAQERAYAELAARMQNVPDGYQQGATVGSSLTPEPVDEDTISAR